MTQEWPQEYRFKRKREHRQTILQQRISITKKNRWKNWLQSCYIIQNNSFLWYSLSKELFFFFFLTHTAAAAAAAAAAALLQSCPTLCDPIEGSPPGSLVPGILQQEHWSGLPFPCTTHESEKWKWSRSVVSDSLQPHGLQPTKLLRPWDFPGKSTGVECH